MHRPCRVGLKDWGSRMCGLGPVDRVVDLVGPAAVEVIVAVEQRAAAAVAALPAEASGIINADLGAHNTVWHEGRPGLFDFNDTGIGPYAFDLARFLLTLQRHEQARALQAAALDGYRSRTPLPHGWEEHGRTFASAADVFMLRYHAARACVQTGHGERAQAIMTRLLASGGYRFCSG